jgi:hypothetical protein
MARRFCWRLGVEPQGLESVIALIGAAEQHMVEHELSPDALFFAHRGGRGAPAGAFGDLLRGYGPIGDDAHPLWTEAQPPTLVIDEVERVWAAIAEHDDWQPLADKVATIRRLGDALGEAPPPAGQNRA